MLTWQPYLKMTWTTFIGMIDRQMYEPGVFILQNAITWIPESHYQLFKFKFHSIFLWDLAISVQIHNLKLWILFNNLAWDTV